MADDDIDKDDVAAQSEAEVANHVVERERVLRSEREQHAFFRRCRLQLEVELSPAQSGYPVPSP